MRMATSFAGPHALCHNEASASTPHSLAVLAGLGLGLALALGSRASPVARAADEPSQRVCIVGEALIDFLPAQTADGHSCYRWVPGGAPFNVCVALARQGIPVTFLGGLSKDLFGEELYTTLKKEGVDMMLVQRSERPSTLAFVRRSANGDAKYAFFKENAADRSLTARGVASALQSLRFGAVHVSLGAVTLEDRAMTEAFAAAFTSIRASGGFTSFDPNVREPMISSGAETYRGQIEAFASSVDLMKSSDADVFFLYGETADLKAVATKWLEQGPKLVVITRGADGASAFFRDASSGSITTISAKPPTDGKQTIDAKGHPAPVSDTVGAGDTCMGFLLVGMLGQDGGSSLTPQIAGGKKWDKAAITRLTDILSKSMTSAAINCSRPGADPPTAAELKAVISAVARR